MTVRSFPTDATAPSIHPLTPPKAHDERSLSKGGVVTGWKAVFVSFFGLLLGPPALLTTSFGVLAAGLEAKTGWTHSAVAYGSTLISLVVLVTAPVQGYLADRLGGRRLVLLSLPAFAVSLLFFPFATTSIGSFYALCVVAALTGIGLWAGPYMKVVSRWFDRHLGLALGVMTTGLGISGALIPLLFSRTYRLIGWGGTYAAAGALILLVVWPATWFWLREPAGARLDPRSDTAKVATSALLRFRAFPIGLLVFLVLGSINAAVLVHGVAILKEGGLSPESALKLQALVGIGAIVGRLGTGWLLDRLAVRIAGCAMFAFAAAYFLIIHYAGAFHGLTAVAVLCGGLVVGAEFDVLGVMIRRHMTPAIFGRAFGFTFASFHLGGAIGSAGLALLLARTGSFNTALTILTVASILCSGVFVLVGPDPRDRSQENA